MKAYNPFGNVQQQPMVEDDQKGYKQDNKTHSLQESNTQPRAEAPKEILKPIETAAPTVSNKEVLNTVNVLQELKSTPIKAFGYDAGFQLEKLVADPVTTKEVPAFEGDTNTDKAINREREQKRLEFLAIKDKVKDIKLSEIAKLIGAHNKEDKVRDKWKMPWGHNVSIKGQKWYNHNPDSSHRSGGGAISFTKYVMGQEYGYDLDDAMQARKAEARGVYWLKETFGEEIDKSDIMAVKDREQYKEKAIYKPPQVLDHYLPKVVKYLTEKRALPIWVVEKQVNAGKLYASIPNNFEMRETFDLGKRSVQKRDLHSLQDSEIFCIFKSGDARLGSAECRCIEDETQLQWAKGFTTSSDKRNFNFFVVGEPGFAKKEVALTESAIDAMSYQALHPYANVTSTGGTDNSDYMMKIAREVIDHPIYTLSVALDNDQAGNDSYDFLIKSLKIAYGEDVIMAHLESGKIKRSKPEHVKDWNQELIDNAHNYPAYDPATHVSEEVKPKKKATKAELKAANVLADFPVKSDAVEEPTAEPKIEVQPEVIPEVETVLPEQLTDVLEDAVQEENAVLDAVHTEIVDSGGDTETFMHKRPHFEPSRKAFTFDSIMKKKRI